MYKKKEMQRDNLYFYCILINDVPIKFSQQIYQIWQ